MKFKKKINPISRAKRLIKSAKSTFGKPEEEEGTRSEAAGQLMKQSVAKQAGGAQINFTEEKYV